jgi:hypothetical protein
MHGGLSLSGKASPLYRHGLYTKEALELRREIAALMTESKRALGATETADVQRVMSLPAYGG